MPDSLERIVENVREVRRIETKDAEDKASLSTMLACGLFEKIAAPSLAPLQGEDK